MLTKIIGIIVGACLRSGQAMGAVSIFGAIICLPIIGCSQTPDLRVEETMKTPVASILKITNLSSQEIEVKNVIINDNPACMISKSSPVPDPNTDPTGSGLRSGLDMFGLLSPLPRKLNHMGDVMSVANVCHTLIQAEIITDHGTALHRFP